MAQELVTLQHPDGRRHRTDNASEINMLISTYGYRRVDTSDTSQTRSSSKHQRSSGRSSAAPEPETSSNNNTDPGSSSSTS